MGRACADATVDRSGTGRDGSTPRRGAGAVLGRYVVIDELGRGGMGVVLRAYDPRLQREVALKTVRTRKGTDGPVAVERIVREARAMARLSHPNVVEVYDVDEIDGAVVLAMELVEGTTLARVTTSAPRAQILALYLEAGRGLVAAHAAGLLHRDFKPTNVLVGAAGEVKVTDFGLAVSGGTTPPSRVSGETSLDPGLTAEGTVVGTPHFMAPEQHGGGELDARADQYAFCVALWTALAREPPFAGTARALLDAKASGPPPWPSGTGVARGVAEAIRRGLSPAPHHRWPAMDALLRALQPVPWWRRHRAALATGGGIAIAAGGWVLQPATVDPCTEAARRAATRLATAWNDERRQALDAAFRATELPYADAAADRALRVLDAYAASWTEHHADACAAASTGGEQDETDLDLRMICLERARVELAASTTLLAAADTEVVERADEVVDALPPPTACDDLDALRAEVAPPRGDDERDQVERVRKKQADAQVRIRAGKYRDAAELADEVARDAEAIAYGPLQTEAALLVGGARTKTSDFTDAEGAYRRALRSALEHGQWALGHSAARDLAYVVGYALERPDEAFAYVAVAAGLVARERTTAPHAGRLAEARLLGLRANLHSNLGDLVRAEQEQTEVIAIFEHVYGSEHPAVAEARVSRANTLGALGRSDEAAREQRAALEARERRLGPEHPLVSTLRLNYGVTLWMLGRLDEAESELRLARKHLEPVVGPDHLKVAFARGNLAYVLEYQGRYEEAEVEHRASLAIKLAALGPDHPRVAAGRSGLANALYLQRRFDEAEPEFAAAVAQLETVVGPDHPNVARVRGNWALALLGQGRYADAAAELRAAQPILERVVGPDHPDSVSMRQALGLTLAHLPGRTDEAISLLEGVRAARREAIPVLQAETAFALAKAVVVRDRPRARRLATEALDNFAAAGEHHRERAEVEAWLGEHDIQG